MENIPYNKVQNYNIVEIYQRAFGYIGSPFPALGARLNSVLPYGTIQGVKDILGLANNEPLYGSFEKSSVLGTNYFMPVKLDRIQLWNEPLLSISGKNKIEITPVTGSARRGSVKELITAEDIQIRIRGLMINERYDDRYPEDQVRLFRSIVEKRRSIEIQCQLTTIFSINQVCIESWNLPDIEGFPGVQPYEITAISDEDYELALIEQANSLRDSIRYGGEIETIRLDPINL